MMTIAKLRTLKDRTCVRKCALLFHEQAQGVLRGQEPDRLYLQGLCSLFDSIQFNEVLSHEQRSTLDKLACKLATSSGPGLAFALEDMHHLLLGALGSEPSDWDFVDAHGALDSSRRSVLPHILILDRVRSPFNVGSIFRSADSFGIEEIWLVEGSASALHPRAVKSSRGCTATVAYRYMSEETVEEEIEKRSLPLFALELGGREIGEFPFPSEGAAVIGSEEMGVSPYLLGLCDRSLGRLSIAMAGTKGSLNVSVATGIMLHRWFTTC